MPFKPKAHIVPLTPRFVAIQGQAGSFSHMTCSAVFNIESGAKGFELHSFDTFAEAFEDVVSGNADAAVIPINNIIAGTVPYILDLLRLKGLFIVGEYFLPIEQCLLTLPGVNLMDVKVIHSHPHALAQCRGYLSRHHFKTVVNADTGGAAKLVSELGDPTQAAIAPAIAAQLYGLQIAQRGIQSVKNNITRFIVVAREPIKYERERDQHYLTAIVAKPLRTLERDPLLEILLKLEEHKVKRAPGAVQEYPGTDFRFEGFFMELVAHPEEKRFRQVMDSLNGICSNVRSLGTFPTHHYYRFREPSRTSSSRTAEHG